MSGKMYEIYIYIKRAFFLGPSTRVPLYRVAATHTGPTRARGKRVRQRLFSSATALPPPYPPETVFSYTPRVLRNRNSDTDVTVRDARDLRDIYTGKPCESNVNCKIILENTAIRTAVTTPGDISRCESRDRCAVRPV